MIGIYKVTNKLNGKFYIGKSKDIEKRWYGYKKFHGQSKRTSLLLKAIQKYGVKNFLFEVIEECFFEQLNEREKFWIEKLQAQNKNIGYNRMAGGDGGFTWNKKTNPQAAEKTSNAIKESWKKNYEKMYDAAKRNFKKGNPNIGTTGFKYSNKSKEKMSLSHLGNKNNQFGKHWYTNGKIAITSKECPEGFYPGRKLI